MERISKVTAFKIKKDYEAEAKRQLGDDYKEKIAPIVKKVLNNQDLSKDEDDYLKKVEDFQIKQAKGLLKKTEKAVEKAADKLGAGAKNVLNQRNVKSALKQVKNAVGSRKPKDDDDLSGDLEENLSLEDYRKKVLEERLVKLTIGLTK